MKTRPLFVVWLLALLFVLQACKEPKKEEGNLTVEVRPFVGSQPLSFSTIYTDGNREFYFSNLKFYLSHIKLIRADGNETEIKDVAYFDHSSTNWKSFKSNVDAGTYKGFTFSVGLDPVQNSTNPLTIDESEPLGPKSDMYWSWLKYRFFVLDGIADTLGNNFAGGNTQLTYHVGRDTCYRTVSLSGDNFTINENEQGTIYIDIDLLKIFQGSGSIDMFTEHDIQSTDGDLPLAIKFADKAVQSFSYSE